MKKTLIALAALAAVGTASAQSTVTLSGIVKGGVAQTKYSNGAAGNGSATTVNDGGSRFILSGTEDLGGGLRANFQADMRFRLDDNGGAPTSSPLGTGNTFIGLSGGFGALQLGKLDTHYCLGGDTHGSRSTALSAGSCAILGFVNTPGTSGMANATRSTNVIRYTTPRMGGFVGQLNYSTGASGTEGAAGQVGKGRAIHGSVIYSAGPLRAGLSVWDGKTENRTVPVAAGADQKAITAMVDWNFGMGTVGLTWDSSERVGLAERDAISVPVTFKLGTGTLLGTYTRASNAKNAAGATLANTSANLWSIGYDYPLSRRTTAGVSYVRLDNKAAAQYTLYTQHSLGGAASAGVGQDMSQVYVGIRHTY